jgi:hypothetical protein
VWEGVSGSGADKAPGRGACGGQAAGGPGFFWVARGGKLRCLACSNKPIPVYVGGYGWGAGEGVRCGHADHGLGPAKIKINSTMRTTALAPTEWAARPIRAGRAVPEAAEAPAAICCCVAWRWVNNPLALPSKHPIPAGLSSYY